MKNLTKKISLSIFAAGAVLLLSGCELIYGFNVDYHAALNKGTVKACQKLKKIDMQEMCITSLAINKRDYSICIDLVNRDKRDICYQKVALVKKDPSICDNIASQHHKNKCFEELE